MSILKADRDLNKLTPDMKERVEKFLKKCKDNNVPVFVTEAYRSQARQNYLYAFGRYGENKDKGKVTWTLKSNHKKREAIDIAFDHPGNIYVGDWEAVFDIAEDCGLKSLFRSTGYDKPHLDYDHEWKPKLNRRKYEDWLFMNKIISVPGKNLDQPPTREEFYKVVVELFKKQQKQINTLKKEIKKLKE